MKIFSTANHLTGSVLAILACASFVSCSRNGGSVIDDNSTTSASTQSAVDLSNASSTMLAQNEMAAPPATVDETGGVPPSAGEAAVNKSETRSVTKSAKHSKAKHKAKKHHKKVSGWNQRPDISQPRDDYAYDSSLDNAVFDENVAAVDASQDFDQSTTSGVSSSASVNYYENGLSPFAQEPASRFPTQIGSGQLTGEDRSTTVLDGPSLFQDPSALGRAVIH